VSLYADESVTETQIAIQMAKLKVAFPKMERVFFDLLAERIIDSDFTEQRLIDATSHVLDNFQYKELNVADIIRFDRCVKLYTGREFVAAQMNGRHCSEFEMREVDGVKFWILKADLIRAGLK
jgi:hypothetical protein